jgi:phosphatidylserine/phosphatidylglycerophosphate/cardiolipin synthase-like enzyme
MLQFLALNGADVRMFTTTTYVHAKYQAIDNGRRVAVSSINWSKTSMTKNREAGALFAGDTTPAAHELAAYMQTVFTHDFDQAVALVTGTWSDEEMAIITDPTPVEVVLPEITFPEQDGLYVTASPSFEVNQPEFTTTVQASPDSAWETLSANLATATTSLEVAMYQVNTDALCDQLLQLHDSGVNVSLLESSRIYDASDCAAAQACYAKLDAGGLSFRKSSNFYSYSHNKYWLVDGAQAAWSTGNWSPTDYPVDHDNVYPPYGDPNWARANRDFTVYTDSPSVVKTFSDLFQGDYWAPETYLWEPDYDVVCGF